MKQLVKYFKWYAAWLKDVIYAVSNIGFEIPKWNVESIKGLVEANLIDL